MHKYLPDGALGSSWHPWLKDGQVQLPIQEDETALVVWAMYEHYMQSKDLDSLGRPAAADRRGTGHHHRLAAGQD